MSASAEEQPVTDLMLIQIEGRLEGGGGCTFSPPPLVEDCTDVLQYVAWPQPGLQAGLRPLLLL